MTDRIDAERRRLLGVLALTWWTAGAGWSGAPRRGPSGMTTTERAPAAGGALASLETAAAWLNSEPLTAAALRGRVTLIDFWTYTCINWMRSEPYVRAWAERYRPHGLVVIGVHTPEFGFERELANVRWAARALRVPYPIAVDNDRTIWQAFGNNYWPAVFFVDAAGQVRGHADGEGGYAESERTIQRLLVEAGRRGVPDDGVLVEGQGVEAAADWASLGSAETYLGYARGERFGSPEGAAVDRSARYTLPERLRTDHWALAGGWRIGAERIVLEEGGGQIAVRFRARDLHLVMGPGAARAEIPFRLRLDGQAPDAAHGLDIDGDGRGVVREPRLYQLLRYRSAAGVRECELTFDRRGVEAYAFTFG